MPPFPSASPRRRARDPRPPHAGPHPLEPLLPAPTAARRCTSSCPPTRPRARSRTSSRRCRPSAADRALLIDDASPDETTAVALARARRAPPPGQPRLRRVAEDRLRAGVARRRRGDRDGPRRQPVRPGPGGRDGRADPGRRGRRRDRLAAARRPRDRGRDAALEVGRQPAADRDREPRLRRALLRVPHGLPRVQRRVPALDPVPAQLRRLRLRPGDLRPDAGARRARASRSRSRRATSTRRRASTS